MQNLRFSVCIAQYGPMTADVEENQKRSIRALGDAAQRGATLVVLPELCTTRYVLSKREAQAAAETLDGPTVQAWAAEAART